jgi:hypothetical protein
MRSAVSRIFGEGDIESEVDGRVSVIIPFYPPKLGTLIRRCVCSVEGSRGKDLQKESI